MIETSRWFEAADEEVASCRRFVRACLADWGIEASDVVLLANELATNAVVHARGSFLILVCHRGSRIRVAVSDDDTRPLTVPSVPDDALSGRGLAMVVALADSWGVDHLDCSGKTVWFELEARPAA